VRFLANDRGKVESFILNQLPSGAFPWDLAQAFSLGAFLSKPWG